MNWFQKIAESDRERIESNIERLNALRSNVHRLGYFVFASNGGGLKLLKELLEDKLVLGRPKVWEKLNQAHIGENNQKIALDAPSKFQSILIEAEALIELEINKEKKALRELSNEK